MKSHAIKMGSLSKLEEKKSDSKVSGSLQAVLNGLFKRIKAFIRVGR